MSSTYLCTESNEFRVKNPSEVREVFETFGLDVYETSSGIYFVGDENECWDDNAEVVLSLTPTENGTNLIGLISDFIEESVCLDELEEDTYMAQDIIEYLQDQLEEGSYISTTTTGFETNGGRCHTPFGSSFIITKNKTLFINLLNEVEKAVKDL